MLTSKNFDMQRYALATKPTLPAILGAHMKRYDVTEDPASTVVSHHVV